MHDMLNFGTKASTKYEVCSISTNYNASPLKKFRNKLYVLHVRALTITLPNYIPSVIMVILVTAKCFSHNCATG
jgi:hypothetical protein